MQTRTSNSTQQTDRQAKHEQHAAPLRAESASVLDDHSSQTSQLKSLQAMMSTSPQQQQRQALQAKIHDSAHTQQMQSVQARMVGAVAQRAEDEEPLQAKFEGEAAQREVSVEASKPNNTGLPNQLKTGIESLSGMSMDHVKVHYNSSKPAQLQAHAYAQGSEIHVAPGQEQHLPHEAWHVVQQAQGRVTPTTQLKGDLSAEVFNSADNIDTRHVSQLAWNKDGDTFLWDQLLDGVAWFANEDGQLWFHISDPAAVTEGRLSGYQQLEGKLKSWSEWNAISVEPHPDFAPQIVHEGVALHVDAPKGGNDKQWFPHPSEPIGWLQARESGKVGAVVREVETILALARLGLPVATIIDRPPPVSITTGAGPKAVFSLGGVWLLQVGSVTTKKPKILGHPMAGSAQVAKLNTLLRKEVNDIPALIGNLQNLIPKLDVLCRYAGEVDIAFTADGNIVILDVAPADGGQVVAQEDGAVGLIRSGIEKLIAALSK
jgi:hypothetical protein